MDLKLFASTFLLIFLAELGDKTQLAAMARTAGGEGSKWTIFAAASAALVFSTLIAVLLGAGVQRIGLPDRYIRMVAGLLFVILGLLLLFRVFYPAQKVEAPEVVVPGVLARIVLNIAADFEEASAADYADLAAKTEDQHMSNLFLQLAEDERQHIDHLRAIKAAHGEMKLTVHEPETSPGARAEVANETEQAVLQSAIQHEVATAEFYEEMAAQIHISSLKAVFAQLGAEEREHVRYLQECAETA